MRYTKVQHLHVKLVLRLWYSSNRNTTNDCEDPSVSPIKQQLHQRMPRHTDIRPCARIIPPNRSVPLRLPRWCSWTRSRARSYPTGRRCTYPSATCTPESRRYCKTKNETETQPTNNMAPQTNKGPKTTNYIDVKPLKIHEWWGAKKDMSGGVP